MVAQVDVLTPITNPLFEMSFPNALKKVIDGKRVTKVEWKDKRTYGFLKDGYLSLHKAGEKEDVTHPWIINDGDLFGEDWIVLPETN